MPLYLFSFLALLAVAGALGVILQRSPVHCLLALAFTLVDIGVLFMGLGAVTVGFLQIIIYVGVIMVLFLFVIWLLNLQAEAAPAGPVALKFFATAAAAAFGAEMCVVFFGREPLPAAVAVGADYGSIERIARMLFSDYLIAFEVTSLLLLAAVAGAIALARRMPAALSQASSQNKPQSASAGRARLDGAPR
jgi:NADH-quinone oxidoreductase subunit J